MKNRSKELGQAIKVVTYDIPRTILKRTFTNANYTDHFPDMKKKKNK